MLALIKWPRRHGSLTKASSSFPRRTRESDRPIRARRRDTQSAVVTALRGEEPARRRRVGTRPDPSPDKQEGSCWSRLLPKLTSSCQQEQRPKQDPEGPRAQIRLRQVDCPPLVCDRRSSSLVRRRGSPLSSQGRFLGEKLCDSILLEHRVTEGQRWGGWRKSRFQSQ